MAVKESHLHGRKPDTAMHIDYTKPQREPMEYGAKNMMGPADTEYLNSRILMECINYVYFVKPLHPDPDYEVDLCLSADHQYGPFGKWKKLGNLRSLHDHWPEGLEELKSRSSLHEEGELYQITCEYCNWQASASVDVEKARSGKGRSTGIITFYSLDSSGQKVWQDPYQKIWYSHTKPAMLDSQGEIKNIPA